MRSGHKFFLWALHRLRIFICVSINHFLKTVARLALVPFYHQSDRRGPYQELTPPVPGKILFSLLHAIHKLHSSKKVLYLYEYRIPPPILQINPHLTSVLLI